MSMNHAQINRAISSAINYRVIIVMQRIVSYLLLREKNIRTGTSTCHRGPGDRPDGVRYQPNEKELSIRICKKR